MQKSFTEEHNLYENNINKFERESRFPWTNLVRKNELIKMINHLRECLVACESKYKNLEKQCKENIIRLQQEISSLDNSTFISI